MRKEFFSCLHSQMASNKKIVLLTADLGFGLIDDIRKDYPDRFFNVGAAEQAMIGAAIGMSYEGLIPFCYSITTFLLYRPFESIRTYINHEKINVKLCGSGRDKNYEEDGISHHSEDDVSIMGNFKNINHLRPDTKEQIPAYIETMINSKEPFYINLKR